MKKPRIGEIVRINNGHKSGYVDVRYIGERYSQTLCTNIQMFFDVSEDSGYIKYREDYCKQVDIPIGTFGFTNLPENMIRYPWYVRMWHRIVKK